MDYEPNLAEEKTMMRRRRVKLVREGQYAAEVEVELIEAEGRAPGAPSADAVAEGG
jgi:hypothetical protein